MKRTTLLMTAALLALPVVPALAHEAHSGHSAHSSGMHMDMSGARKTLTGEVVDTGCYLGSAERGAKHVSCATKCIGQGMPMGLLTSGGALYLITMNHDNTDPYNELKTMAGKTVSVTGTVMSRSGMKAIEASEIKAAAAAAAK